MTKDEKQSPWYQKMALIESLTPEQMIQIYPKEFTAILSCSKIPDTIFLRVINGHPMEGICPIQEQLHLVCNKYLGEEMLQMIIQKTPFEWIRGIAVKRIYIEKNSHRIAMNILKEAQGI